MRMAQGLRAIMKEKRQQGEGLITLLQSLSPLTVLTRGYSLVESLDGKTLVYAIRNVSVGDFLYVRLVMERSSVMLRKLLKIHQFLFLDRQLSEGIMRYAM